MITVSQNWINYFKEHDLCNIRGTLTDVNGNSLSLNETDFMMGSVSIREAVSSESTFEVGSVITSTFNGVLNNTEGKYNDFNLKDARISIEFGLSYSGNLFADPEVENGGYDFDTGEKVVKPSVTRSSKYFAVSPSTEYVFRSSGVPSDPALDGKTQIYWYTKDFEYIEATPEFSYTSNWYGRNHDFSITSPSTAYYCTFAVYEYYEELVLELEGSSEEWINRGTYTLDNPKLLDRTLSVIGYNDLDKLNKLYVGVGFIDGVYSPITLPMKSSDLVSAISNYCGVPFGTWSVKNDITVSDIPYNESTTCRMVISWILQINGGFARINEFNELDCEWYSAGYWLYNVSYLDGGWMNNWNYSGGTADGGTMNPWEEGYVADGGTNYMYEATQISSVSISTDSITITGVKVSVPDTLEGKDSIIVGQEGYIIQLLENPLVTKSNYVGIANALYTVFGGYQIKPFDASIYGHPAMEAGDIIAIRDYLGRLWITYVTSLTYNYDGLTEISCGAESITEANSSYGNEGVSVAHSAVNITYEYLQTEKLSADYVSGGTLGKNGRVSAIDFEIDTDGIDLSADEDAGEINVKSGVDTIFHASSDGTVDIDGDGAITISGDVTANSFINTSMLEMKHNLKKAEPMLDKIMNADILTFSFKNDKQNKKHMGLAIGEDYNTPSEIIADVDEERQGIDLYSMVSMAWKAIQEQQAIINELREKENK